MQEKVVETKVCKQCNSKFEITDKDLEFYKKISPKFDGKIFEIPSPAFCPDCRLQRRLSFRNEKSLYRRKCDATGESIISMFSPDKNYKVVSQDYWWSDNWDPLDYGVNFDFDKSFFGQFEELIKNVPTIGLLNSNNEGCEYNNYISGCKNCYLSSAVYLGAEDIFYSILIFHSKDIFDCKNISDCSICYQSLHLKGCYNCFYLTNSSVSKDCYFSRHLIGCNDCIFCTNLTNKQYHIFNKPYSKEEYLEFKQSLLTGSYEDLNKKIQEFDTFSNEQFVPNLNIVNCEDSIGHNIFDAKNSQYCYDTYEIENCKWVSSEKTKDSYDGLGGANEVCYEYTRVGWGNKIFFTNDAIESNNLYYCNSMYSSNNCFGCVGLRNKQYCILNKQYTKEEYEKLLPQIISHMQGTREWGEFFPSKISPFGYNETTARELYPLDKEDAINQGFKWSDYEAPFPKADKKIPASSLPDNIADIPDDILNRAIICDVTKKPFKIISQELEFYRKYNLPVPRKHPDTRYIERIPKMNPRQLFDRKCDKCGKDIQTVYLPNKKETIYCESCYEKEVF